jgi:hypothetical protein
MRLSLRPLIFVLMLLALQALAGPEFRGNKKSHVFHSSSCRYFSCSNCTAVFSSAAQAAEAGYRPCGLCRPTSSQSQRSEAKKEDSYSGNTNSLKFHRSSCRYFTCKSCTAKFSSREAAIKAGYSPGGCCKP